MHHGALVRRRMNWRQSDSFLEHSILISAPHIQNEQERAGIILKQTCPQAKFTTAMLSKMFKRYDLDDSGTLNEDKEMRQLFTNLCLKLGIVVQVQPRNRLHNNDNNNNNPMYDPEQQQQHPFSIQMMFCSFSSSFFRWKTLRVGVKLLGISQMIPCALAISTSISRNSSRCPAMYPPPSSPSSPYLLLLKNTRILHTYVHHQRLIHVSLFP